MDKIKNFVGQPILKQIITLIPSEHLRLYAKKFNSDRYYKRLPFKVHLTSLLYGVFSYCNGLREICEGLLGCEGRLGHVGFEKTPARSTLSDANRKRSYLVFEALYFALVKHYISFISDSRLKGLSIRNLKIIDSTTIRLFSDILKGVGQNPKDGSKKKGGLKVHALMDAFSGVTEFARITAGKDQDVKFLRYLKFPEQSWIVFDKGYYSYKHFAKWSDKKIWFVTRMKDRTHFHVHKIIQDRTRKKDAKGVLLEEYVTVSYFKENYKKDNIALRRITFKAEDGKIFVFLTNNFILSTDQIALIYKNRWMIELLFKQIKQNFPLKYFWGESVNAIKTQIYCVLIAQLLMVVLRKKSQTKKAFSNMITLIRLHLMSYVEILMFIKDTNKAWQKTKMPPLFSG